MRKSYFYLLYFLLISSTIKAQSGCFLVPDSIGKELAEILLHKAPLSASTSIPDKETYINLLRKVPLNELEYLLPVEAAASETIEQETEKLLALAYDESFSHKWDFFLRIAKAIGMDEKTATYKNTFYEIQPKEIPGEEPFYTTMIYSTISYRGKEFAFAFYAWWKEDKWIVMDFVPYFLLYAENEESTYPYKVKRFEVYDLSDNDYKKMSIDYNTEYQPKVNTKEGEYIVWAEKFAEKTLNLIKQKNKYEKNNDIMSQTDFNNLYGGWVDQLVQMANTYQDEDLMKEVDRYRNNPNLLYEETLKNAWGNLIDNIVSEYDISSIKPNSIDISINNCNFDEKYLSYSQQIIAEIRIEFTQNENSSGMIFKACWRNGKWELVFIQDTLYGISMAQDGMNVMDETEDAVAVPILEVR